MPNPKGPPPRDLIARAVAVLHAGELVCFPTETFYGLAADALDEAAVARLVAAKGREPGKPIAVIVAGMAEARLLWTAVPPVALALAERYWPGPLTLVLAAGPHLPAVLIGPDGGVGARVSSHPWAQALAQAFGGPITATSANLAGGEPPRTAAEARHALGDRAALVLDAGPTPGGPPSTVVAVDAAGRRRVLRAGAIAIEESGP